MKDLLQKAWTLDGIFTKYSKQKLNTTLRQTNVKRASGQIFLEEIPGKLSKALLQCNTSMCIYIWQFNLNFKFSLVLKFQQLQFSSSALDCYNGNISISGINYSKQSAYKNEKLFYFCGSYSSFTIYPKSINALFLNLFAGVEVKFHLNGFFEIIDSRFIVSHQLNGINFLQMSLLKVREKYNLYHFYIQIKKNLCIQVKTEINSHFIVFDGPGFQSNVLKRVFPIYKTSTFQCLVQLLKLSLLIDILNYTSTLLTIDQYLEVDDSVKLVLPNNRKNVAPLVLSIGIKNGFHINVSLNIIRQTNGFLHSPDCKFGGVAFFKDSGQIFHEIQCICQDFSSSLGFN